MLHALLWVVATGAMGASPLPADPPVDSPEARYQRQFVGIDEYGNADAGRTYFVPYQGKYKRPLEGADFYEAVARPDLAASYRHWSGVRLALELAGPVTGALGLLWTLGVFHSCPAYDDGCSRTRLITGLSLVGGGLALNWIGASIDPEPVSHDEARRIVDQYDRALRQRLQLDGRPKHTGVIAAITPVPGGAAAALCWTF